MTLRRLLPLCALAGLTACPAPDAALRDSYTYELALDESVALPKDTPAPTLILSGKELGSLGTPIMHTLPADKFLTNAAVQLRVETSCGPANLPADLTLTRDVEERFRSGQGPIHSKVKLVEPLVIAPVYLDNVQGKEKAELTIGKLPRSVEAGQRLKSEVVLGACPEAKKVGVKGVEVGELGLAERKVSLVDASGRSCYESAFIAYVTDPSRVLSPDAQSKPERYAGKRVYLVDVPDYFLENPPQTKQLEGDHTHHDRVLRHVPCGR